MLTELDLKLIEKEKHRFDNKFIKRDLFPIETCPMTYQDVLQKYDLYEHTEHWYDSGVDRYEEGECKNCENDCQKCKKYQTWDKSEAQLSFNNWIDVWGPGIWGMTQRECNNMVRELFENTILKDPECNERLFWYQPLEKEYFHIFYYNRDKKYKDWWFVFKMREAT